MNTTTKIAAGTVGAAVVAASLWLLPAGKTPIPPAIQTTADAVPWEEIPTTPIPSLNIVSTTIGETEIESVAFPSEVIGAVGIKTSLIASQGISVLDIPANVFGTMKDWRDDVAKLNPEERQEVLSQFLRSDSSLSLTTRAASLLWFQEMQKDAPNEKMLAKYREAFGIKERVALAWYDDGLPVQPVFAKGTILWDAKQGAYDVSRLSFPVIDVDPAYGPLAHFDFAAWAQRIYNEQPGQVVIGWDNGLNNFEKPDTTKYAEYFRQIRAVVRMVREVSPRTFVWITVVAPMRETAETYKPWMERMAPLGDGIALWGVSYFGAVEQFPMTRRKVQKDAGGKPVMLLGFFGYKCFEAGAVKPPNFERRMDEAEQAARDAGFAGFLRVEAQ